MFRQGILGVENPWCGLYLPFGFIGRTRVVLPKAFEY
jgi:hypothetical protein